MIHRPSNIYRKIINLAKLKYTLFTIDKNNIPTSELEAGKPPTKLRPNSKVLKSF